MALQKTVTTAHGIEVINAYHRVENLYLLEKTRLTFVVRSKVAPEKPAFSSKEFSCYYDIAGENPIKQAYEHLKTLSEFADATDV